VNITDINVVEDIFLIDKPKGWTSFDVVAKIRGELTRGIRSVHDKDNSICPTYSQKGRCKCKLKVGHTGTLDPAATGLLVLAIGKATKKIQTLIKVDKVYEVEATLGFTSTTGDSEGELVPYTSHELPAKNHESGEKLNEQPIKPSLAEINAALKRFIGQITQVPPKYSAIKVNGIRAYNMAREGKEFELKPRQIEIEYINDVKFEFPKLIFTCKVSSGTYIRSLVEDIGKELGYGAYMSNLRRTEVGEFKIEDALRL